MTAVDPNTSEMNRNMIIDDIKNIAVIGAGNMANRSARDGTTTQTINGFRQKLS